jgi:hypothetical protein
MNWLPGLVAPPRWHLVRRLSKQVSLELEKFFVAAAKRQSKTRQSFGWRGQKGQSNDQELRRKFLAASEK